MSLLPAALVPPASSAALVTAAASYAQRHSGTLRYGALATLIVREALRCNRRWGCAMLAKCSNPYCYAPFLYLEGGRLFRLESDPTLRTDKSNRVEFFWLCHRCASTMTLRLGEDERVVAVPIPEPIRSVPGGVALISANRKRRLLVRNISSPC